MAVGFSDILTSFTDRAVSAARLAVCLLVVGGRSSENGDRYVMGDLPLTANEPGTIVPVFVPVEIAVVHHIGRQCRYAENAINPTKQGIYVVPVERIELPTFGLQNGSCA
jgi:hypothetical protein